MIQEESMNGSMESLYRSVGTFSITDIRMKLIRLLSSILKCNVYIDSLGVNVYIKQR